MIQTSWAKVEALGAETVAVLLFTKIFEKAPEAVTMFRFGREPGFNLATADLSTNAGFLKHGVGVVQTVGAAVNGLNDLPSLVPVLTKLGYKHMQFHVTQAHYPIVGQAFLDTLQAGLGDAMTPDLLAAYTTMWSVVQATMLRGAVEK